MFKKLFKNGAKNGAKKLLKKLLKNGEKNGQKMGKKMGKKLSKKLSKNGEKKTLRFGVKNHHSLATEVWTICKRFYPENTAKLLHPEEKGWGNLINAADSNPCVPQRQSSLRMGDTRDRERDLHISRHHHTTFMW